jgi:hypothetical protein
MLLNLFAVTVPVGTPLWKSLDSETYDVQRSAPAWFTTDWSTEHERARGRVLHCLTTRTRLRLVDVASPHFRAFVNHDFPCVWSNGECADAQAVDADTVDADSMSRLGFDGLLAPDVARKEIRLFDPSRCRLRHEHHQRVFEDGRSGRVVTLSA